MGVDQVTINLLYYWIELCIECNDRYHQPILRLKTFWGVYFLIIKIGILHLKSYCVLLKWGSTLCWMFTITISIPRFQLEYSVLYWRTKILCISVDTTLNKCNTFHNIHQNKLNTDSNVLLPTLQCIYKVQVKGIVCYYMRSRGEKDLHV